MRWHGIGFSGLLGSVSTFFFTPSLFEPHQSGHTRNELHYSSSRNAAGFIKTVPSVFTLLLKTVHISHSTQVPETVAGNNVSIYKINPVFS